MKRIIYFLLVFAVLVSFLCNVVAFASEVEETPTETVEVPETPVEEPDLFTRLYEAFADNKSDVFTLGGSAVLFVLSIILKKDLGNTSKHIVDNIARVLAKTDISDEKQNAIVGGLNEMVDGYNEIKEQSAEVKAQMQDVANQIDKITVSNASLETKIDEVFNVIISLMDKEILQNSEVMEVLTAVYSNNSAVPKGIKDFIALKRTENVKLTSEATALVHKEEGGVSNDK